MALVKRLFVALIWIITAYSFSNSINKRLLSSESSKEHKNLHVNGGRPFGSSTKGEMKSYTVSRPIVPNKGNLGPLSVLRTKDKEKFVQPPRVRVEREFKTKSRIPLSEISVGQKMTGKIISIVE